MSHPDRGRVAQTPGTTNIHILTNQAVSESPASTNHSTPAARPAPVARLGTDEVVPTLRLDDIQSTIPFHEAPQGNESKHFMCE